MEVEFLKRDLPPSGLCVSGSFGKGGTRRFSEPRSDVKETVPKIFR